MKVLIVESSAKSKTIGNFLGEDYVVLASGGHIRAIDPASGSVSIGADGKVNVRWMWLPKLDPIVKKVQSLKPEEIVAASDPDREGERIAFDLREAFGDTFKVSRARFSSITLSEVLKAVAKRSEIDDGLALSSRARAALDYFLGYGLSGIAWRKVLGARSVGRVQAPSLAVLARKELAALFQERKLLWKVEVKVNGVTFTTSVNDPVAFRTSVSNVFPEGLKVLKGSSTRKAPEPFSTSEAQVYFSKRFSLGAQSLMIILQRLYSGSHSLGSEGGLISYMRTDSRRFNPEFLSWWLEHNRSSGLLAKGDIDHLRIKRFSNADSASLYDAHEAIRPTSGFLPDSDSLEAKVYREIYNRSLACFMKSALYSWRSYSLSWGSHVFTSAKVYTSTYRGWENVGVRGWDARDSDDRGFSISVRPFVLTRESRMTEGGLISYLKSKGIGRPSTWQSIVPILKARGYVISRRGSRTLRVSHLGLALYLFLNSASPSLMDEDFTSRMEDGLDSLATLGQGGYERGLTVLITMAQTQMDKCANQELRSALDLAPIAKPTCCDKDADLLFFSKGLRKALYYRCQTCQRTLTFGYRLTRSSPEADGKWSKTFMYEGFAKVISDDSADSELFPPLAKEEKKDSEKDKSLVRKKGVRKVDKSDTSARKRTFGKRKVE